MKLVGKTTLQLLQSKLLFLSTFCVQSVIGIARSNILNSCTAILLHSSFPNRAYKRIEHFSNTIRCKRIEQFSVRKVLFSSNNNLQEPSIFIADLRKRYSSVCDKIEEYLKSDSLNLEVIEANVRDLESETIQESFWENQNHAQTIMAELTRLKNLQSRIKLWGAQKDDIQTLFELLNEDVENMREYFDQITDVLNMLEKDLENYEIQQSLSGKYDTLSCFISIQSGTGGTDAQDWVGILYRMYKRYAEKKGFQITVMDESSADFGYKSVEMRIDGSYAYGFLKSEKGTHRLVRISPFNSQGKRQTSFAAVEVWPVLEERDTKEIEIPEKVS